MLFRRQVCQTEVVLGYVVTENKQITPVSLAGYTDENRTERVHQNVGGVIGRRVLMSTQREGGISGLLPMSYRGRAEAFARHLHCRLRSLGSDLPADATPTAAADASSWISGTQKPLTTTLPRQSSADSDLFYDFSPGSPVEEVPDHELTELITNATDDLQTPADPACHCLLKCASATLPSPTTEDASETSDSSDYFDPENIDIDVVIAPPLPDDKPDSVPTSAQNGFRTPEPCPLLGDLANGTSTSPASASTMKSEITIFPTANQPVSIEGEPGKFCCSINIKKEMTIDCTGALALTDVDVETETAQESVAVKTEASKQGEDEDVETEERIPRVRRCSSLKTGKTPPGTPGQKKIVRFADVLGLDLADVRTYLDEIPKIPTSAYEDLTDVDMSLTSADGFGNGCSSSCLDSRLTSMFVGQKPDKILVPLFAQPGGEADFLEKVKARQCCLENACVQDTIALSIAGMVRVRNLDFHKSVHIRYSLDGWLSFADLQATYVTNSCDGFSDKFSFLLYCHTLTVGQRIEFAVRFQAKGVQYWDNNLGLNYCFQCLPASSTSPYLPITSPEEHWGNTSFY